MNCYDRARVIAHRASPRTFCSLDSPLLFEYELGDCMVRHVSNSRFTRRKMWGNLACPMLAGEDGEGNMVMILVAYDCRHIS